MQNIAKMNNFCSFSEGSLGRVLQNLYLSKIIILPSCAEELRTAKQGNDLKHFICLLTSRNIGISSMMRSRLQ